MRICNFPGARRIGSPKDWDTSLDGECLDIFVCDAVDTLSGLPIQYTVFQLSDEEIEALRGGGVLRLGIVGMRQHPVFNIGILSPAVVGRIGIEPQSDLGGVIGD